MTLIKKIISWLKKLFSKLFKKNKKTNKSRPNGKKKAKDKGKERIINQFSNEEMPSYMILSQDEKEKLIYSIAIMKNILIGNNQKIKENEEKEIVDYINKNKSSDEKIDSLFCNNELIDQKEFELVINDFPEKVQEEINNKYEIITRDDNDFKVELQKIDEIVDLIKNTVFSIATADEIENEVTDIINDKKIYYNTKEKIDGFTKRVNQIINNYDGDLLHEVNVEYNKINYVTISAKLIDKNYEQFRKLEDDFKNHRYNKFYYEREIGKIKNELNKIKDLKSRKDVNDHINLLRKELYTKSKDKYDLLYNNEIFMNIEKECNSLLDKINVKVIDIKKEEPKEEEKDNKKQEKEEYLRKILLRFQDMELARELILLNREKKLELTNKNDIINHVNEIFNNFDNGVVETFNFEKNRDKTELVILYNEINRIESMCKKEPFISIDHINFKMDDLIEASRVKKDELNVILKKYGVSDHIEYDIDGKLDLLSEKYVDKKKHVLKKNNENR